ncbi:MAG TPA: VIT domain-containing protein [Terriglobales bacterium]|nr:VIT domain-containing protein [Terriglobales bacterium]
MTHSKARGVGLLSCLIVLGTLAPRLRADGLIVPNPRPGESIPPPLSVKFHRVTVEVTDQVARTSVDQVFVNNFDRDIEGIYIFPVPEGASVGDFALFVGGQRVAGEVLDSAQARRVYEDIVRRLRDPGLLEYVGRNAFRARVYPIPARGEKRVQISYTEVLKSDGGLVKYLYPLNTERFSRDLLLSVSLTAHIASQAPILNVYSPSHRVSVRRMNDHTATAGYEESNVRPDRDFVLYYSLSRDDVGLSFLNCPEGDGGYFLLLASPRYAAERERVMAKDVVLVLDSSGSMAGTKIQQVKGAAEHIVRHLGRDDRFSLIDFDDQVSPFSDALVPATAAEVEKSVRFIYGVKDAGGTNINDALVKAMGLVPAGDRPAYVLFLTDGQPTVGTTETAEILKNVARANKARARLAVFGVGNDVNTELLDLLSNDHRGTSVYVGEDEPIEAAISGFYERISSPLLAGTALGFEGIETSSVYPQALPDLFKGSQVAVVGRYKGAGPVTVVLTGKVGRAEKRFVLESLRLAGEGSSSFLPRLWATRRIGSLLGEIRLRGPNAELVDEVTRLGLRYGIVTPYTSFLVTEKERLATPAAAPEARDAMSARQVSGGGAVRAAKIGLAFLSAPAAATAVSTQILYKDGKTFYLRDGAWVDSEHREGLPVREVRFDSDEYYRLVTEAPALARYLSAARTITVVYKQTIYKIVE